MQNLSFSIDKRKNNSVNKYTIKRNKEIQASLKCMKKLIYLQYQKPPSYSVPKKAETSIINIKIERKRPNKKAYSIGKYCS